VRPARPEEARRVFQSRINLEKILVKLSADAALGCKPAESFVATGRKSLYVNQQQCRIAACQPECGHRCR
jgi:hypothetical protein